MRKSHSSVYYLKFKTNMIWREPKNHRADSYFCQITQISQIQITAICEVLPYPKEIFRFLGEERSHLAWSCCKSVCNCWKIVGSCQSGNLIQRKNNNDVIWGAVPPTSLVLLGVVQKSVIRLQNDPDNSSICTTFLHRRGDVYI